MSVRTVHLGDISAVGAGQGAPQDRNAFSSQGHPFIRAASLDALCDDGSFKSLERINEAVAKKHRLRLYVPDTVIFAKSGMSATKNRIYRLSRPAYVVNHLATVSPSEQLDSVYLRYWLEQFNPTRLIQDIAYPSISLEAIESVSLSLPDLSEQKRVAGLLAQADRLRRTRRYALELSDAFLPAAFLELFGRTSAYQQYTAEEFLDDGTILEIEDGNHGEAYPRASEFSDEGVPFLTATNVSENEVRFYEAPRLPEQRASLLRIGWIKPNDVLLSHNATVGRVAVVPNFEGKAVVGTSLTFYRLNLQRFDPSFFAAMLRSEFYQNQLASLMKQTTRNQVPVTRQLALRVFLPPFHEQQKFATFEQQHGRLRASQREALRQADHLFQSLLHRAFS